MWHEPRDPEPGVDKGVGAQPSIRETRRGEKSLAGLTAAPAVTPKLGESVVVLRSPEYLRWMALRPRPMMTGTRLLMMPRFLESVTARMMMRSAAEPRAWSKTRLAVETLSTGKNG